MKLVVSITTIFATAIIGARAVEKISAAGGSVTVLSGDDDVEAEEE